MPTASDGRQGPRFSDRHGGCEHPGRPAPPEAGGAERGHGLGPQRRDAETGRGQGAREQQKSQEHCGEVQQNGLEHVVRLVKGDAQDLEGEMK